MSKTEKKIGNYRLVKTLGNGSFGKVKLAEHIYTSKTVALKILNKSNFNDRPERYIKLQKEIALLNLFNHPHIIKLFEVFESPKHLFLVTEYAENGDLFDVMIKDQKLSEERALKYFREMIYALEYLQKHEICHRDLKLENLFIDSNDNLKLGDFGFAQWMRTEMTTTPCGSPHYAAPEVLKFQSYSGKQSDIWSAGVILYSMVVGKLPFDDNNLPNLIRKIELGEYPIPFCHPEIRDLISKMLVIKPELRYTIEQVKSHPAFFLFLPENYILPSPLPLPIHTNPFNVDLIHGRIINILKQVGFKDIDEVIKLLQAKGQNMAKVFYLMLIRFINIKALPWKSREDPMNCDESKNEYIISDIFGDGCYSLATNEDWNIGDSVSMDNSDEYLIDNISMEKTSLPQIWASIQTSLKFPWFHPHDNAMIINYAELKYMAILVQYIDPIHVSFHLVRIGDHCELFDSIKIQIQKAITDASI